MNDCQKDMIRRLFELALVLFLIAHLSGCTKVVHGISQIQSPVTYRQTRNKPERTQAPTAAESVPPEYTADDTTDKYSDLIDREKLFGISLSGGGARAVYFASKVLRDIEEAYQPGPLYKQINFYSSVSGGSIVNAYIGAWMYADHIRNGHSLHHTTTAVVHDVKRPEGKPFNWIHNFMKGDGEKLESCGNLGEVATHVFFDPMNLGLPIFFSFFTNKGYSRYLILSAEYCLSDLLYQNGVSYYRSPHELPEEFIASFIFSTKHSHFKLSDLGGFEGSRHYINATILETGQRLVFANEKYHNHLRKGGQFRLDDIVFLEDLYSSIKEFSIADAAIASMSFPGATEPVVFDVYDGVATKNEFPKSIAQIQIVDGSVFDNTGLATLVDIMFDQVIVTDARHQELIILMVDSDNSENKTIDQIIKESSGMNTRVLPQKNFKVNFPIKGIGVGIKSAFLIYELNKRNSTRLLFHDVYTKLNELNSDGRDISLKILPICIGFLAEELEHKEVVNIETYYSIPRSAVKQIEKAVEDLMQMKYSDALNIFKRKYFLEHDAYVDSILYQSDESFSVRDTIVQALAAGKDEKNIER
jgi:predicted acylesterase/phospholipase RssA